MALRGRRFQRESDGPAGPSEAGQVEQIENQQAAKPELNPIETSLILDSSRMLIPAGAVMGWSTRCRAENELRQDRANVRTHSATSHAWWKTDCSARRLSRLVSALNRVWRGSFLAIICWVVVESAIRGLNLIFVELSCEPRPNVRWRHRRVQVANHFRKLLESSQLGQTVTAAFQVFQHRDPLVGRKFIVVVGRPESSHF